MTSTVAALILAATFILAVPAASPASVQPSSGGAGGKHQPEPKPLIPMTAARVFTDARDALRTGPLASRLTVTVIHKGRSPSSANILLRTASGKERDQRDARVSIDAGDLRIYAEGGQLTAAIASNPTTYYRVDIEGPPTLAAISKALHPLPIPELSVFFADGDAVKDPTPLTRGIAWNPITRSIDDPTAPITLTGAVEGREGEATMTLEYQTVQRDKQRENLLRMRSFSCPLASAGVAGTGSAEERSLSITSAWTDPGDPAKWKIDTTTRTRVDSLAALGIKIEPPPSAPPAVPPATPPTAPAAPAPAEPKKPEESVPKADPATQPKPE